MNKEQLREELANKIDGALTEDCHPEVCQTAYNIADIILSPECLKLLAPLYSLDEEKVQDLVFDCLYSDETDECLKIEDIHSDDYDGVPGYTNVSFNISKALYQGQVIKVSK